MVLLIIGIAVILILLWWKAKDNVSKARWMAVIGIYTMILAIGSFLKNPLAVVVNWVFVIIGSILFFGAVLLYVLERVKSG